MSSHHIVREGQEPALLVLNAAGFSTELLGQLLEWSPTVIAPPIPAAALAAAGIKVDWVTGEAPTDLPHARSAPSDLPALLQLLKAEGYSALNIINTHTHFAHAARAAALGINIVVYTPAHRAGVISGTFKVWKPAGTPFSITPIQPGASYTISGPVQPQGENHIFTSAGIAVITISGGSVLFSEDL